MWNFELSGGGIKGDKGRGRKIRVRDLMRSSMKEISMNLSGVHFICAVKDALNGFIILYM